METIVVYSLVVIFLLGTVLFVSMVLLTHPYASAAETSAGAPSKSESSPQAGAPVSKGVTYAVLAALMVFLCIVTVFNDRPRDSGQRLDRSQKRA